MDKVEEIKMYIEYMMKYWIEFYTLSKGVKDFKYDPTEELNKMTEHMENDLESIEFKNDVDLDVKQFIRDYKLENILKDEKN